MQPGPVAIIASRYNASVTGPMRDAAAQAYLARGGSAGDLAIVDAPGAFELPALAAAALSTGRYRAVVCLGCVVRGETPHDEHIARAVAHALADLSSRHATPVAFGVLTVLNAEQARARAGGAQGNKGAEAMDAALDALAAADALRSARAPGLRFELDHAKADKSA
jgi:6,7-dimethyl-8-ribityllumazine synthase